MKATERAKALKAIETIEPIKPLVIDLQVIGKLKTLEQPMGPVLIKLDGKSAKTVVAELERRAGFRAVISDATSDYEGKRKEYTLGVEGCEVTRVSLQEEGGHCLSKFVRFRLPNGQEHLPDAMREDLHFFNPKKVDPSVRTKWRIAKIK